MTSLVYELRRKYDAKSDETDVWSSCTEKKLSELNTEACSHNPALMTGDDICIDDPKTSLYRTNNILRQRSLQTGEGVIPVALPWLNPKAFWAYEPTHTKHVWTEEFGGDE